MVVQSTPPQSKRRRQEKSPLLRPGERSSPIVVLSDDEELPELTPAVAMTRFLHVTAASESTVSNVIRRASARLQTKGRPNYCLSRPSRGGSSVYEKRDRASESEGDAEVRRGMVSEKVEVEAAAPSGGGLEQLEFDNGSGEVAEVVEAGGSGSTECAANARDTSAYTRVRETLRCFNKHYLHFVQIEEKRCRIEVSDTTKTGKSPNSKLGKKSSRRPDLKAITEMIESKEILYPKTIGNLEGINVGHQFYSRAEMVVLGFHCHWLNGIDYIGVTESSKLENKGLTFPLASSIVMSGQYEDDVDNLQDVVYTGQGGNNLLGDKRQIRDQELKRGNLALKNNMEQKIPVRVTRGHVSKNSYVGKVYTYDGLYEVIKFWAEKGVSGFTVFKYQLRRILDQPTLTTNQVNFSRTQVPRSTKEVRGLVSEDISGGLESLPIPATNVVDNPPVPPSGYVYTDTLQVKGNICLPPLAGGCSCKGNCVNPRECACAKLNGSDFPYVQLGGGRLVEAKDVVFECGPHCGCGPDCINRTSQRGLRYHLEVFRTPNRGWGVRSWDHIPPGAPICEYKGVLMKTDELDTVDQDTFIFEIDCLQTMKGLDGRESRKGGVSAKAHACIESSDDKKSESIPEFCIDAWTMGNVSRFINHSCQPNLFVQCVLSSHHDIKQARIVLFAADHIPPLQELTYDYGYALDSVIGRDGRIKKMPCYCGAPDCRKRLY